MILIGSTLLHMPVMGLQTGSELARLGRAIIDPANLAIAAYELDGAMLKEHPLLVRIADIRELSDIGMIVDSSDEFVAPDDVIKLHEIYKLGFNVVGMSVTDEKRQRLGKVIDFTLETNGFIIQQLTVKRPLLKSFTDTELLIHRSQIIEINNDAIVVHSEAKAPEPERSQAVSSYVNPFRKTEPAADATITQE